MEYEVSSSIFNIMLKSLKITCNNFSKIFKLLLYPVFGQAIGVIICFVPLIIAKFMGLDYALLLLVSLFGLAIGLTIFCHAFWKYLLCQGVIVQMAKKIIDGNGCQNLQTELDAFSRRSKDYVKYLLLICLISILLMIPSGIAGYFVLDLTGGKEALTGIFYNTAPNASLIVLVLPALFTFAIVFRLLNVFFTVSLQSFALNPMLIPMDAIKKSVNLVKKSYFKTFFAIITAAIFIGLLGLILKGSVNFMLAALPQKTASLISEIISNLFAAFFTGPFYIIFASWWYLRLSNKEK